MSEKQIEFTKKMKRDYTILAPNMAPMHFRLLEHLFAEYGYNIDILKNDGQSVVNEGLKYVHNDTCYPALLVIGQMLDALHSGKYDLNKVALMITQTGGGCRASNYIHLLRKALVKAGLAHIPVISLNLSGLERNSGFSITLSMLLKGLAALAYGDMLMLLNNQTFPYELNRGESEALVERWITKISGLFAAGKGYSAKEQKKYLTLMADDFAGVGRAVTPKVKVGIVGEIYVKYSPLANNGLEKLLAEQGCEVMVPGILNFMLFKVDNRLEDIKLYGGSRLKFRAMTFLMNYLNKAAGAVIDAVKKHPAFTPPSTYIHLKKLITGVIGYGCKMGEGWLLTSEMMELIESGYRNIVCAQPFGCLPNHIVGKGMIRKLKNLHPDSNIVPIDYDPGATKVNQENRIKLMIAVAKENLQHAGERMAEPLAGIADPDMAGFLQNV
jgi:predicted nucleotide-binding protein (sugar kinase/HSP70/actin superfamily)